ncbi:MAG: hypothetical protein EON93_12305, partial [Burkholderiales bacterium]
MDTVSSKSADAQPVTPARIPVLRNGTTISGAIVATAHGAIIGHFYGWVWCAAWCVASIGILIWLVRESIKAMGGNARAETRSHLIQFALITLWMASAVALFVTGSRVGWILSITVPASWAIHIIFAGKANQKVVTRALAVCAMPLVGVMLYVAWIDLPIAIAIAGTVAALGMLAGIGEAAKLSSRTYSELQRALAESSSTKERLE